MPQMQTKSYSFESSERHQQADGSYIFNIPDSIETAVSIDLASFETQAVEPNVSSEENKVTFTEGLRVSTGEAPTLIDDVPVFDHEFAIRETDSDGNTLLFKLGLCPHLNEVSNVQWDDDGDARTLHSNTTTIDAANDYFSTTRNTAGLANFAAPHYGAAFQACQAQNLLTDMELVGVCMATVVPIDFADSSHIVFADVSPAAAVNGGTQFRVASTAARDMLFTGTVPITPTSQALSQGFIACSPWYPPDIVAFLNYQLSTVTNSLGTGSDATTAFANFNRCTTGNQRPANTYQFEYTGGRFRLLRISGSTTFEVVQGATLHSNYRWASMHRGDESGAGAQTPVQASSNTTNTGHGPRNTRLWSLLGFTSGTPTTIRRRSAGPVGGGEGHVHIQFGVEAPQGFHCVFSTEIDEGYYGPQTVATAVSSAMNLYRPLAAESNVNANDTAFAFVDSVGVNRTVAISCSHRTPYQLAEALEMVLNRLDARGIYYSGTNYTVNDANTAFDRGQEAGTFEEDRRLLYYSVTYDSSTKRFTFTNREVAS
ncbi:hypothetical protein OAM67_01835, partial [bacterium]|nr:hypothetical protein [bacterium]